MVDTFRDAWLYELNDKDTGADDCMENCIMCETIVHKDLEAARIALKEILDIASRTPIILATTSPDGASCGTGIMKIRRLATEALEETQ